MPKAAPSSGGLKALEVKEVRGRGRGREREAVCVFVFVRIFSFCFFCGRCLEATTDGGGEGKRTAECSVVLYIQLLAVVSYSQLLFSFFVSSGIGFHVVNLR